MSKFTRKLTDTYTSITGYTYSNMARLFMRLFVGVMFMQFGIRHLINYDTIRLTFPTVWGFDHETALIIMICVELICSLFIMTGFLTRLACIPPILVMIAAEYYILHEMLPAVPIAGIDSTDPGYLPIMFIGIYLFLLLAGPGKISLDYFFSLFLIEHENRDERTELEEV